MIKKIFLFTLLVLTFASGGLAQHLQPPYLVSTGGRVFKSQNFTVHWAVGEIAVTELRGSQHLTQGFYQGYNYKSATFQYDDGHVVSFYPNPISNELNVEHDYPNPISLNIYDMMGRILLNCHEISSQKLLDLSGLQTGTYIIRFINADGKSQTKKLIKI